MIQRENNDPEKAYLVKEKLGKRKQYSTSTSRPKSNHAQRTCDSSSSENHRHNNQYKDGVGIHHQTVRDYRCKTPSLPGEKCRWSCGKRRTEPESIPKLIESQDTCSCVSCALKKLASSEYTCIACLSILFFLSVLVAFLVLFKTVPIELKDHQKCMQIKPVLDEPILRKTKGMFGVDFREKKDGKNWDDTISRHLSSLTGLHTNDFDDGGYRDMNTMDETGMKADSELSSVLDAEKLNDGLSSERLRSFYKKLIQTDAQIRNLKKSVSDYSSLINMDDSKYQFNSDRSKRSLKVMSPKTLLHYDVKKEIMKKEERSNDLLDQQAHLHQFNLFYPPFLNSTKKNSRQFKRYANGSEEPTGFLVEKKQILVQYKPSDSQKKVPKCSHTPKESKSHEKQMKHPFYKNSQRLDELLDQFLDKNIPDMMADPFGVDVLFKKNKNKLKTYNTNFNIQPLESTTKKTDVKANSKMKENNYNENLKYNNIDDKSHMENPDENPFIAKNDRVHFNPHKPKMNKYLDVATNQKKLVGKTRYSSTGPPFVLLSVSTIINSGGLRKLTKPVSNSLPRTPSLLERVPHIRKLMQFEQEDDEGLGYEDFKEVLTDDSDTHDENDKVQERNKRMDDSNYSVIEVPTPQKLPSPPKTSGVHNPNWKGALPLYPDELSTMIKQAAIQNVNKVKTPINTKDLPAEIDEAENDLSDIEYIESYSDNKNDKLVKMAQAYSDYGVLEAKKDSVRNENKAMDGKGERRTNLSLNERRFLRDMIDKLKSFKRNKWTVSEGIRFEICPSTTTWEDDLEEIKNILAKHVKLTPNKNVAMQLPEPDNTGYNVENTDLTSTTPKKPDVEKTTENDVVYTIKVYAKNLKNEHLIETEDVDEYADNTIVFTIARDDSKTTTKKSKRHFNNVHIEDFSIKRRSLKSIDEESEPIDTRIKSIDSIEDVILTNKKMYPLYFNETSILNSDFNKIKIGEIVNKIKLSRLKREVAKHGDNIRNSSIIKETSTNLTKHENSTLFGSHLINTLLNLNNNKAMNKSSDMDLSEFFMLMSNWFSLLAASDVINETTTVRNQPESSLNKFTTKKLDTTTKKSTIEYPMYDSDMIENIGHRSRVLLGIEEVELQDHDNVSTDVADAREAKASDVDQKSEPSSESAGTNEKTTTSLINTTENNSLDTDSQTPQSTTTLLSENSNNDKNPNSTANKTVVKRNVPEESNLIFWNDMYDDEYGIRLDPIDQAIRDKHNVKGIDFVKKSGNWIQNKVRTFANNFRVKEKATVRDEKAKKEKKRPLRRAGNNPYPEGIQNGYMKRSIKYDDDESDVKSNGFAALTARMKEVCKEAAKTVQQTKNIKVREEQKEDSMTTTLMQQLAKLMTELIDFQVQQQTCVKLPPDLQEFLEWMTLPDSADRSEMKNPNSNIGYSDESSLERPTEQVLDLITTPSSEKEEVHPDIRSDCLGTLHAVQDLMQQFDDMSDEDKSKMTGIREYLENQLQFLHKQLTPDDDKTPNMFDEQNPYLRYRRDLTKLSEDRKTYKNQQKKRRRNVRIKRRFVKNYGKKRTKTTASIYDAFPNTEMNKASDETKDVNEDKNYLENNEPSIEKRNLQDVYYRALYDAKKSTTYKSVHKDEMEGFDNAQIVRIEN